MRLKMKVVLPLAISAVVIVGGVGAYKFLNGDNNNNKQTANVAKPIKIDTTVKNKDEDKSSEITEQNNTDQTASTTQESDSKSSGKTTAQAQTTNSKSDSADNEVDGSKIFKDTNNKKSDSKKNENKNDNKKDNTTDSNDKNNSSNDTPTPTPTPQPDDGVDLTEGGKWTGYH